MKTGKAFWNLDTSNWKAERDELVTAYRRKRKENGLPSYEIIPPNKVYPEKVAIEDFQTLAILMRGRPEIVDVFRAWEERRKAGTDADESPGDEVALVNNFVEWFYFKFDFKSNKIALKSVTSLVRAQLNGKLDLKNLDHVRQHHKAALEGLKHPLFSAEDFEFNDNRQA